MRLDDLKVEYRSLEDQTTVAKNAYTQVLDSLNKTTTSKGLDYRLPVSPLDRASAQLRALCAEQGAHHPHLPAGRPARVLRRGVRPQPDRRPDQERLGRRVVHRRQPAWASSPTSPRSATRRRHQLAIRSKATPGVEAFLSVYSAVKIQSKLDYPEDHPGHEHHSRRRQDPGLLQSRRRLRPARPARRCWSTATCAGPCCTGISICRTTPAFSTWAEAGADLDGRRDWPIRSSASPGSPTTSGCCAPAGGQRARRSFWRSPFSASCSNS